MFLKVSNPKAHIIAKIAWSWWLRSIVNCFPVRWVLGRGRYPARPTSPGVRKPSGLVYGVNDVPPRIVTLFSAVQHIGVIATSSILPLVVMREIDATPSLTASVLSLGMIVSGLATMLQARVAGAIGSGYLIPSTFSGIYLGPSLVAAKTGGLPLVFGMTIFAGLFEVVLSRIASRVRPLVPPELAGLVLLLLSLLVGAIGLRTLLFNSGAPSSVKPNEWLIASISLHNGRA